jgi:hypothetical protein
MRPLKVLDAREPRGASKFPIQSIFADSEEPGRACRTASCSADKARFMAISGSGPRDVARNLLSSG